MILKALKYKRYHDTPREWSIEGKNGDLVSFGNINLLVGKNAAGKSRTLSVIKELSKLLMARDSISVLKFPTVSYEVLFGNSEIEYCYKVEIKDGKILEESIFQKDVLIFDRIKKQILNSSKNSYIPVDIKDDWAVTSLCSSEYPILENLKEWGFSIRDSIFANQLEKQHCAKSEDELSYQLLEHGTVYTLFQIFEKGRERFGEEFISRIRKDMAFVGYNIQYVDVLQSKQGYALHVKEEELDEFTNQLDMSQGMYRMLSFIIKLNYALLNKVSVCFLADDLGEGLDYDRSKSLISLIIKNLTDSTIQTFMTTNDRYMMNKIPLKYWSVVERIPKKAIFYNYYNSKEIFDDFKYTGLNNFDFLATDFYIKGFDDQD